MGAGILFLFIGTVLLIMGIRGSYQIIPQLKQTSTTSQSLSTGQSATTSIPPVNGIPL